MKKAKSKIKQNKNLLELLGIGGSASQTDTNSSESAINADNWDEYLGIASEKRKQTGDLYPGQELNLRDLQEENEGNEKKSEIEPGIDYSREIVHVSERVVNRENQELEMQLKEIMAEIKKLADSSKELQMQFKEVAVEQHTAKPGKYHKNFFSWLLSIIKAARMRVEDSGAWLQALQSKKKSREYGAMAKKYKSSFTLNNERTVATQVG